MLHNAKDSKQIVQVSLKYFFGFMLIIRCMEKEKKGSSEQNKDNNDINAQVSKIQITWNVMLKVNGT